jgi:transposase
VDAAVSYGREREDYRSVRFTCLRRSRGRQVGIDEISRKKGHVYHTQVYDLENKRFLWTGAHRDKDSLRRFFDWWGEERTAAVEGVCCDMWQNYIDVIHEYCGEAVIVFDLSACNAQAGKFHIVRHLIEAVDKVRRMEAKALAEADCEVLKGTRYIWLKNPWNLTDKQRLTLSDLLTMNLKVAKAYLLKELFRKLWTYKYKGWAAKYLKRWFWPACAVHADRWATHSRIKPLRDFAWMLQRHEKGILAYFKLRIDNGSVEAMNNNAKAISHRARGYRSEHTFSLAMLHGLAKLELPQCQHTF